MTANILILSVRSGHLLNYSSFLEGCFTLILFLNERNFLMKAVLAWAAITKHHGLGGLNKFIFSFFWRPGSPSPRSRSWPEFSSWGGPSSRLVKGTFSLCYVLKWQISLFLSLPSPLRLQSY